MIKVLTDPVCGESPLPGSQMAVSSLDPTCGDRATSSLFLLLEGHESHHGGSTLTTSSKSEYLRRALLIPSNTSNIEHLLIASY